jgi:glutamate-1-semialdehyde 2,1-aminomutase
MITGAKLLHERSALRSEQLAKLIPGGVNSPFRSFFEVGGHTIFFSKARGSQIYDIDGNSYIDYLGAWGPAVLGHCHPQIIQACQRVLEDGPVFGCPHELELELAQSVIAAVPSLEQVRFVNSGTEAVMSAVRLARGVTGRSQVVMFEGCYHGHSDATLATSRHATSSGVPAGTAQNTLLIEFNNLAAMEEALAKQADDIAAVLIEPIAASMSVIAPVPGFLARLRELCSRYGILLIFDEVLTGFRVALGGAQEIYDVQPDLTCLGKALAGGMSIGAYGGAAHIMNHLFPIGDVYQAGTFSGNPVTMAGGVETIRLLSDRQLYVQLEAIASRLFSGIAQCAGEFGVPVQLQRVGSLFSIAFAEKPILNYGDSLTINNAVYAKFFHFLLEHGIYLPPSAVDAACLSTSHSVSEIDTTIEICRQAFKQLAFET